MKKTSFFSWIAVAALMALVACKPTNDPQELVKSVTVLTAEPTLVINTNATLGAEVTASDPGLLLELGVCWSRTENPTIDDNSLKTYRCSQPFQCFVGDLEPNTEYHVRGYAKYGTEYCYGEEKTFTTHSETTETVVATMEAYDITSRSFWCNAVIREFGATNWYAGVCYSTQPDFTMEDAEGAVTGAYSNGICTTLCEDLMPNTQYYYRAFVAYNFESNNNFHFLYGNILSLTTPPDPFTLFIDTYSPEHSWGDYYMIARGGGYCTQPDLINQVGFCYSKTNQYPQYESDLYTIAASSVGDDMYFEFRSYIGNLSANSKYYVRSYARYMTDSIKYGDVVAVDTH